MNYISQLANSLPQALDEQEQNKLLNIYYASKDENAREVLLEHNLRLCLKAAIDVCSLYGLQDIIDQAFSVCYEELSKSLDKFEPNQNTSFASYVIPNMKFQLIRFLERETYHKFLIIDSERQVRESERDQDASINIFDHLQDNDESLMQEHVAGEMFKEDIIKFINRSSWPQKKQVIVKMYLGLEFSRQYTKSEIANIFQISRQRTTQIINESLFALQKYIKKNYHISSSSNTSTKQQNALKFESINERNLYIFESYYGLNGREQKSAERLAKEVFITPSIIREIAYSCKDSYDKQHNSQLSHTRMAEGCYYKSDKEGIFNDYFGLNGSKVHSKQEIISKYNLRMNPTSINSLIIRLTNDAISEKRFTTEEISQIRLSREQKLKDQEIDKYKYAYCSYYGLEGHQQKRKFELSQEFGVSPYTIEGWLTKYKKYLESKNSEIEQAEPSSEF